LLFADLFPTRRGRPSVPADVVAMVLVLQALEGHSDRDAIKALRRDIAWKAAAGLALTDEAFNPTVLTLWRNRLRASKAPQRIFDAVRAVIIETRVIAGKHRRVLDSTVLDDAVARQDTVTMLVEQIRRVRRFVPELAGVPVREHNLAGGRPPCDWDDPADRDRLVSELVDDANELVWAAEDLDLSDAQGDAVALLALVAGQDVEPGDGPGRWWIAQRTVGDQVISTVDPEARHAHKTRRACHDGYKVHVAAEPDTGLVTACDIGPGNAGDAEAAPDLIAQEPAGTEVLGDSAYSAGEFRAHLRDREMTAVIKPPPLRPAVAGGFSLDDFIIDTTAGTVTCPEGVTVTITPAGAARFGGHCHRCPVRHLCTTATGGRVIDLHPHHDLLAAARRQAETDRFDKVYRRHRPMIERTIAWLVANGHRRLRHRGTDRNRLA
jgi:IS5 family transposase